MLLMWNTGETHSAVAYSILALLWVFVMKVPVLDLVFSIFAAFVVFGTLKPTGSITTICL